MKKIVTIAVVALTAIVVSGSMVEQTLDYVRAKSPGLEDDITIKMKGVVISDADRILRHEIAFNRAVSFSNVDQTQELWNIVAIMAEKIDELESEVEKLKGVKI